MYYDLAQLERESLPSWETLLPENPLAGSGKLPIAHTVKSIIKQFCLLPEGEIAYDVVTAYFLIPSALAKVCPILFLQGRAGSGKSNLGFIASQLYHVSIFSSSDTFASIRNELNKRKYITIQVPKGEPYFGTDLKTVETNTFMVWDDIDADIFSKQPDIYRMLKYGYDRSSDTITISSEKSGENLSFRCFCPKLVSSISPIHRFQARSEFARRVLVIHTKRIQDFTPRELENVSEMELKDKHDYSWQGFHELIPSFWGDQFRAVEYISTRVEVQKQLRKMKPEITPAQSTISVDLLTAGVIVGVWQSIPSAIAAMETYWTRAKAKETLASEPIEQLLDEFLEREESAWQKAAQVCQSCLPLEIPLSLLRRKLNQWSEDLPESVTLKAITPLMIERGYRLEPGKWILD